MLIALNKLHNIYKMFTCFKKKCDILKKCSHNVKKNSHNLEKCLRTSENVRNILYNVKQWSCGLEKLFHIIQKKLNMYLKNV